MERGRRDRRFVDLTLYAEDGDDDDGERVYACSSPVTRGGGHLGQLRAVVALVGHLVGHDQVVLGIDGGLHVVADHPSALGLRHH